MTWGALYMYYHCPKCGMKFEYALDVMTEFGDEFGFCPECHVMGVYEKEGAKHKKVMQYRKYMPTETVFEWKDLKKMRAGKYTLK